MKTLFVVLLCSGAFGCAGFHLNTGDLVAAAHRACAVVDALEAEEVLYPEDIKEAKKACRILRAVAGLPPLEESDGSVI